ncbi:unnamed protein product [Rangifer tarandus platyrhynchus]|uniref:Uncharacterized protein n=1 Tax=Rangifer tarandus platyrhynchus TaxID=3082113 RepID=A0ABN8ZNS9_RANTA|nr:unnamed protein product [Rangifer tarandus platyrhynchus]
MESRVWPRVPATWRPLGPAGQAAHHSAAASKRWRRPQSGLMGQEAAPTHTLLPRALQRPPHCSGSLQDALVSTRQRRKLRLGTAGTRVSTLSRLMPTLPTLGTHPRGDPDPGLEEKAGVGPISATAAPGRMRRGAGGSTELRGLLTRGSHRSVKSFCTSLRPLALSSREPAISATLLGALRKCRPRAPPLGAPARTLTLRSSLFGGEDAHSSLQQRELCTVPGSEGERPVRCGPHILDLLTSASPPGPPAKASA